MIGTAIALLLLTNGALPLWCGVLAAAVAAYAMLFLEKLGVRYLEAVFHVLIAGGEGAAVPRIWCVRRREAGWYWQRARGACSEWAPRGAGCQAAHPPVPPPPWSSAQRPPAPPPPHPPTPTHTTPHPPLSPAVMSVAMGAIFFQVDIPYGQVARGERCACFRALTRSAAPPPPTPLLQAV